MRGWGARRGSMLWFLLILYALQMLALGPATSQQWHRSLFWAFSTLVGQGGWPGRAGDKRSALSNYGFRRPHSGMQIPLLHLNFPWACDPIFQVHVASLSQCGSWSYKAFPLKGCCACQGCFAMTHHFLSCVIMYCCWSLVSSGQITKEQQQMLIFTQLFNVPLLFLWWVWNRTWEGCYLTNINYLALLQMSCKCTLLKTPQLVMLWKKYQAVIPFSSSGRKASKKTAGEASRLGLRCSETAYCTL